MKFPILILCFIISMLNNAIAQSEADYTNAINESFKGQREYPVTNGRVDILTDQYAIEVERAPKWKNSIGQALWYALQTNRKPGIVVILESPSDYKYFQMLNSAIDYAGLTDKIKVWEYPRDFGGQLLQKSAPQPKVQEASAIRYGTPTNLQSTSQNYWMTISTKKRHNSKCRYFRNSKGRSCNSSEGIACGICGG